MHIGKPQWKDPFNINLTLATIDAMALRYGNHSNLFGIELMNEPSQFMSENDHAILERFYQDSYKIIRGYSNTTIIILNELYEHCYASWNEVMLEPEYYNVMIDFHLYDWGGGHNSESKSKHIRDALNWGPMIEKYSRAHPVIVGELWHFIWH